MVTIDKEGKRLDDLGLAGKHDNVDPDYQVIERVNVFQNRDLVSTDSIFEWKSDEHGFQIGGSKTRHVTITKYEISDEGQIENAQ